MKPKIISSALLIYFLLSANNLSSQTIQFEKLKLKETSTVFNDSNKITLTEKSPLFAGSLSFIVPGLALGQFYNEQIFKGLLHIGISGIGFYLFLSAFNPAGSSNNSSVGYAGFLIYLSNWFYTIFEAIASAEEINKQIKLRKYRSGVLDKFKFGFTLDKNKNLSLKFALDL